MQHYTSDDEQNRRLLKDQLDWICVELKTLQEPAVISRALAADWYLVSVLLGGANDSLWIARQMIQRQMRNEDGRPTPGA